MTHIKVGQFAAGAEQVVHISYVACIPATHIKAGQLIAFSKHALHVGHILRVEAAHVNRRQISAFPEHASHSRHVFRVQVLDAGDVGQFRHFSEPMESARRACSGKRRVEHHLGDIPECTVIIPFRIVIILVQVVHRLPCTDVCRNLPVVVEGQRGIAGVVGHIRRSLLDDDTVGPFVAAAVGHILGIRVVIASLGLCVVETILERHAAKVQESECQIDLRVVSSYRQCCRAGRTSATNAIGIKATSAFDDQVLVISHVNISTTQRERACTGDGSVAAQRHSDVAGDVQHIVTHEVDGQVVEGIVGCHLNARRRTAGDSGIGERQHAGVGVEAHRTADAGARDIGGIRHLDRHASHIHAVFIVCVVADGHAGDYVTCRVHHRLFSRVVISACRCADIQTIVERHAGKVTDVGR